MDIQTSESSILFRQPKLEDGLGIYHLIQASPPLDVNSSYLYFLQASHFADTCVVAEVDDEIVGFISAYYQPGRVGTLFVWQVAVSSKMRGQGLAKRLLTALLQQQPSGKVMEVCCTISPSNKASQGLFKSFAKQYGLTLQVSPFITEDHFGDEGHEAEEWYALTSQTESSILL